MLSSFKTSVIAIPVVGLVVVGSCIAVAVTHDGHKAHTANAAEDSALAENFSGPPSAWQVVPNQVPNLASFPVLIPATSSANTENVTAAFVSPSGSEVILEYPTPVSQQNLSALASVRQPRIEVVELPWAGQGDAATAFQQAVNASPAAGKTLCKIAGLPAICVSPNSPSDVAKANPAFVVLDINGVEVQVFGGVSLDDVSQIAAQLAAAASSGPGETPTASASPTP